MRLTGKSLSIVTGVKHPRRNDNVNLLVPEVLLPYVPVKVVALAMLKAHVFIGGNGSGAGFSFLESLPNSYFFSHFLFCTIYPTTAPLVVKPISMPIEGCGVKMYITAPMPPHINPPKIVPSTIALIVLSSIAFS